MKTNAAARKPNAATLAPSFLVKADGRTRLGRAIRSAVVANDTTPDALLDVTAFAAPALPEVRQVTVGLPELPAPCDARVVVDVIRAGWCSTSKTLSYGLARAGIATGRIQAVILAAMKSGLIECVRGVWAVSSLAV